MASSDSKAGESLTFLDRFSAKDIEEWNSARERLYDHYWNEYSYYANERSKVASKIRKALLKKAKPLAFEKWYRIVTYKFSDAPLSSAGSRLCLNGGRFNIGDIDKTKFPTFPCLYIAKDEKTAIAEKFSASEDSTAGLTKEEFSGAKISHSTVRISGKLAAVLDTTDRTSLKPFINIIKKIPVPESLVKEAKKLKLATPGNISTPSQLQGIIRDLKWQANPNMLNIPSPSQIFGQMVKDAGVQGLIYNSKHTDVPCLAIFPECFEGEEGEITLADESPEGVTKILNHTTWQSLS